MRVALLLLLLLTLPAQAAETLQIAGVCPGMAPEAVQRTLGAASSKEVKPEFEFWKYGGGVEVTFSGVPLRVVSVQGPKLSRGGKALLNPKSTEAQVTKALGKPGTVLAGPDRPRILMYPRLGLNVTLRPGATLYTLTPPAGTTR